MTSDSARDLARRSYEVQREKLGKDYQRDMSRRSRLYWDNPRRKKRGKRAKGS